MRYQNLTPEALAQSRPAPVLNADGTWPNWPPAATTDQPKGSKGKGKTKGKRSGSKARTAKWVVARAFKSGSGRYS